MEGKKTIILASASIVIIVIFMSYNSLTQEKMDSKVKYHKVVVIGIDGFSPRTMDQLMSEGKMPNFKRLSQTGSYMRLVTSYPPNSPVAWTSIATGRNPGKHSIFDFIRRDPSNYLPQLALSKETQTSSGTQYGLYVTAEQFWKTTSAKGIPTTIVRWPVTFPPDAVDGDMLSGLGVPDIRGFLSGYGYYTSDSTEESSKTSNRIIKVDVRDNRVESYVGGPRVYKGGAVEESKAQFDVMILSESKATLATDGKNYGIVLGKWSDWIKVTFRTGMFTKISGKCKVLLIGTNPFKMYVTAIQIDPDNPVAQISSPVDYSSKLASQIGSYYTLGMPEETDGYVDGRLDSDAMLSQMADIESERDRMFWLEFDKFIKQDRGVFAFVYDTSDRVQHVFWDQKVLMPGSEEVKINDAVVKYYMNKDRFLGDVLSKLDDKTLLLVVSDHGFTSFERGVSMNNWLLDNGYLTLTQDIPPGEDGALFKYVDWSKTKAYSLGFNSIYINLKGREGKGIVDPQDREKVVSHIISGLQNLTDDKYGKNVLNRAYTREEVYSGDYLADAPDIIVGFNPGYRMGWQNAIGGFAPETITDNTKKWDGDHLVDPKFVPGILFSNVNLGQENASQMDVAPTILDSLGINEPQDMDGRSLLN